MKQIQSSAAKARFSQILKTVAAGEPVEITLHGRPIVRMVPAQAARQDEIRQAIEGIKALRKKTKGATIEEILAWRDEGRK